MSNSDPTKIQFVIWKPLLEALRDYTEQACLRRDAYLAKVLAHEIEVLARQTGRNSDLGREFLHRGLKSLDCQSATFTLPADLIDRINEVCRERNLHRDCFFNRVLLLITPKAQRALYEWLYASDDVTSVGWHALIDQLDTFEMAHNHFYSKLHIIRQAVDEDPLGMIREAVGAFNEKHAETEGELDDPLILLIHPSKVFKTGDDAVCLAGLNVLIEDVFVDGSKTFKKPISSII